MIYETPSSPGIEPGSLARKEIDWPLDHWSSWMKISYDGKLLWSSDPPHPIIILGMTRSGICGLGYSCIQQKCSTRIFRAHNSEIPRTHSMVIAYQKLRPGWEFSRSTSRSLAPVFSAAIATNLNPIRSACKRHQQPEAICFVSFLYQRLHVTYHTYLSTWTIEDLWLTAPCNFRARLASDTDTATTADVD